VKRLLCVLLVIAVLPFTVAASSPEPEVEQRQLPILMYHHVLNGRTGKYIVNERQLESDFIYLKKQGYETVFLSEVLDWMDGRGKLPKKPILLTFDDGHYSNMHYAYPLAKKHGVKFMIFPVTSFSRFSTESGDHSNPNYSHLTFEQMRELHDSGIVEFGNHTNAMHKFKPRFGVLRQVSETLDEYRANLEADIAKSQKYFTDHGVPAPLSLAYPFGKYDAESQEILIDLGFRALLTCTEGVSVIKQGAPSTLWKLKRFNRDGHRTTEDVFSRLV